MRVIALFLVLLGLAGPALAQPVEPPGKKPMSFRIVTNDPDAPADKQRRWVTAHGALTPDTPQVFDWFLKGNDISGLTIYFDSAGGSIVGGIRLGEALRKIGARVAIGRSTPIGEEPPRGDARLPRHQLVPGRGLCFSSCAYAFLGGKTRLIAPSAAYGVHMFWPGDQLEGILTRKYGYAEIERAQRISANLAAYIQRMGGDLQLLQLAAATPPKGAIRRLSPREILNLKVAALDFSEPAFAGAGNWGIALEQKRALLSGDGEATGPAGTPLRYTLEFACASTPGFNDVRFEMAPITAQPNGRPLAFRRALVVAGAKDGVIARQGKDVLAAAAAFPRRVTENPNAWIGAVGTIPADVLAEAGTRKSSRFAVRIEDSAEQNYELPLQIGNLPAMYERFSTACARVAAGQNAIP